MNSTTWHTIHVSNYLPCYTHLTNWLSCSILPCNSYAHHNLWHSSVCRTACYTDALWQICQINQASGIQATIGLSKTLWYLQKHCRTFICNSADLSALSSHITQCCQLTLPLFPTRRSRVSLGLSVSVTRLSLKLPITICKCQNFWLCIKNLKTWHIWITAPHSPVSAS